MAATDKTRVPKPSTIGENQQGQLVTRKGLSREVIEELSKIKGEPGWMRDKRLKSFEIFERKPIPTWGVDLSDLNLDELVLYSPPEAGHYDSWDDVPQEQKDTFEKLGIPQAEREHLAGVVGVWRQEMTVPAQGKQSRRAPQIRFAVVLIVVTRLPPLDRHRVGKEPTPAAVLPSPGDA